MLKDKKNLLLLFFTLVITFFIYFSYQQNKIIGLLNQEIIKLANQRQKIVLEKYALQKDLQRLKDTIQVDSLNIPLPEDEPKNEE